MSDAWNILIENINAGLTSTQHEVSGLANKLGDLDGNVRVLDERLGSLSSRVEYLGGKIDGMADEVSERVGGIIASSDDADSTEKEIAAVVRLAMQHPRLAAAFLFCILPFLNILGAGMYARVEAVKAVLNSDSVEAVSPDVPDEPKHKMPRVRLDR